MSSLETVIQRAVTLVEPSPVETRKLDRIANRIFELVQIQARKASPVPQVVLGGSFAKDTWLKGEADIDVFLKFPADVTREVLKEQGLNVGRGALKNYRQRLRYAEHPYVEGFVDSVRVNVVACFNVEKGKWISAADRSPYHTEFIKERFDDSLRREARLIKKFMKGLEVYGAEIAVQGFSGYVCEVMALKFGSFLETVSSAAKFRRNEVISIERAPEELVKIFRTPLIILDPVDIRRNLGAAISTENVAKLMASSRSFLRNPSAAFFLGWKPSGASDLGRRVPDGLLALVFKHSERSEDILWGQLRRTLSFLRRQLELGGFEVFRVMPASDNQSESGFLFLISSYSISKKVVKVGPDVYRAEDVDRFVEKNRGTRLMWIGEDSRIYAIVERKFFDAARLLSGTIRHETLGVSPGLRKDVSKGFRMLSGEELGRFSTKKSWLKEAILKLVSTDRLVFGSS